MKGKGILSKIWYFIWEDDSIWSWIVNIILAFILIKFVIYPGLGFAFQTSHPIVAVVSGSMEHRMTGENGNYVICNKAFAEKRSVPFNYYWDTCGAPYTENFLITKDQFSEFPFKNGFNKGDIMILYSPKNVEEGDVIVYNGGQFPIIHRIVDISERNGKRRIVTMGDHNGYPDPAITEDRLIGKAVLRIPALGYIKILAVEGVCLINDNPSFCNI